MSKSSSSVSNAYNNKILDLERYNGRVNLMEQPDPAIQFQMAEKVALKNKATEYRGAIAGEWEDNILSQVFFSAGNIQILQNGRLPAAPKRIHRLLALLTLWMLSY